MSRGDTPGEGCGDMSTLQNGAAVSPFRQEFYKMIAVHKTSAR